jgi:hypothetical protein
MHGLASHAIWRALLRLAACAVVVEWLDVPVPAQQFQLTDAQFDSWITNGRGDPAQLVESQLAAQLDRLDDACNLSDDQRQKLLLAGRGDVERFLGDMNELRVKLSNNRYDRKEINQIYAEIRPLAQRMEQGLLGAGSLFAKVKDSVLDDQQRTAYREAVGQRIAYYHRAKLKMFVVALDQLAPMTAEQRKQLLALLVEKTEPPNRRAGSQLDWWYVIVQAAELPASKLAEMLDDAQLRCFQQAVRQADEYRQVLKNQNIVPFDGANEAEAAAPPGPVAAPAAVLRHIRHR